MFDRQFAPRPGGHYALHHVLEMGPAAVSPKIVHQESSSVSEIVSQRGDFRVAEFHAFGVRHKDKWVISQRRIGEFQNAAVGIGPEGGELLEARGEVQIGIRVIVDPAKPAWAAGLGFKDNAGEHEDILRKAGRIGPDGQIDAVGSRFARGPDSVLIDPFVTLSLYHRAGIAAPGSLAKPELRGAHTCEEQQSSRQENRSGRCGHHLAWEISRSAQPLQVQLAGLRRALQDSRSSRKWCNVSVLL